jgi:hypothetical protein
MEGVVMWDDAADVPLAAAAVPLAASLTVGACTEMGICGRGKFFSKAGVWSTGPIISIFSGLIV